MGDFVVAAVIAAVGLWVVVHEELAHRGLLPSQQKAPELLQQLRGGRQVTRNQKGLKCLN